MNTAERMAARQPDYYKKSKITKELLQTYAGEIDAQNENANQLRAELRASTATDTLPMWERDYGVTPGANDTAEERCRAIILQMQAGGTVTPETLRGLAETFFERECRVTENFANYSVTVSAMNGVAESAIAAFQLAARKLIPAHLGLTVKMEYNTWGDVHGTTWETLAAYTWNEILVKKGEFA